MSDKDLLKEMGETAKGSSVDGGLIREEGNARGPVFYQCKCPECGRDDLELYGFDPFLRSEFLGVANDAELGCGDLVMDGDYNPVIECGS